MFLKKVNLKETRFSHIAMCINASETPFLSSMILCVYVLKIITLNGLLLSPVNLEFAEDFNLHIK